MLTAVNISAAHHIDIFKHNLITVVFHTVDNSLLEHLKKKIWTYLMNCPFKQTFRIPLKSVILLAEKELTAACHTTATFFFLFFFFY